MEESSGDEMENNNKERIHQLGFKPQKELWFNKYLPYAEEIDEESVNLLKEIKQNLCDALVNKEVNPGLGIFASRLLSYIKLYGLKFSKEDHVLFIKVLIELMCIPHLEPSKVNKFCFVVNQLLAKPRLLSPDDLQIDWKPLYELSKIYLKKNSNKCVMYRFLIALENNLIVLIMRSTLYFPKSATQEILEELYTTMEPLDTGKGCEVFTLLSIFLNTYDGHELWLDKFLTLWNVYHNPPWNVDVMQLVGAVARRNIGRIDWEPHIPVIFTRILRFLELPVTYKSMSSNLNQNLGIPSVADWIVAVLGPNSGSAQKYLNNFMSTIESYVHPANTGKWVEKISELLSQLARTFEDRIYQERYERPSWMRAIPESHKLTDKCITDFVLSIKPVAMQAIYSRMDGNDVGTMLKVLAELRPELIIPGIIEKVYSSLDLLTEPHKLTAALQTLVKVARPLVCGHGGYTEGKTHVIPILMAMLPGIDPNDFKKTSLVLQFYVSFSILVPLVDCSKASQFYDDLTEEERLICEQSAVMEDFVLQFLDRIFILIDSNAVQTIRMEQSDADNHMSRLEAMAETSIISSVLTILSQSSKEIIEAASRKTLQFVKTHIFETKVAGVLVGGLVRIIGRVAGDNYFRIIVPYLLETLEEYFTEHDDIANAEKQSNEVQYYLLLLLNVVRGDPRIVINYIDLILPVLDKVLTFKCPHSTQMANNMILYIMGNFSTIQTDFISYPEILTKPISEFLPIRYWGTTIKPEDNINWYIPGEQDRKLCESILYRYLPDTLEFFNKYINDEITPSREEMLTRINLVTALLRSNAFLPSWTEEDPIQLIDSAIKDYTFNLILGFKNQIITMPDGSNVRLTIIDTITRLQEKMLAKSEDDIKSFKGIIQIWDRVHMRKHGNASFEMQLKNYFNTKLFQENRLTHNKRSIRCVVALRALIQQNCRDEFNKPKFTHKHETIMKNLIKLSTSKYSSIRQLSQFKLISMLTTYPFSYKCLIDDVVDLLRLDTEEHHDQFKGALYILYGQRNCRFLVKRSWESVRKLWIALLESKVSEKPSITKLLDGLIEVIKFDFPTLNIRLKIPHSCIETALKLSPTPRTLTQEDIDRGNKHELEINTRNENLYYDILNEIINIIKNKSLHWRYNFMASSMLLNLVHPDVKYPEIVARYFTNGLINDLLPERKIANVAMGYILLQQKRTYKKITVEPHKIAGVEKSILDLRPGIRDDNRWLQYDLEKVPRNQEEWDEPRFFVKPFGFFGWKNTIEMYAPTNEQPSLEWSDEMNSIQKMMFDFFSDSENVDKLIKYWSLEGKKGRDKFNQSQFFIIRALFKMFGDAFVENFLKHLPKLISEKQFEGNHRCAAEVIAGLIRATKLWPFGKTKKLFETLKPLIQLALNSITTETDAFWGGCFSVACESMDPMRLHFLYEVLLDEPLRQTTSYIDCSRIFCLQGAYNEHVWRMNSVSHRLLDYFRPYLSHPFQNVRETIGNILINIFEIDFIYPGCNEPEGPRMAAFMAEILPQIQILHNEFPVTKMNSEEDCLQTTSSNQDSDFYTAVRLFKTIAHWIMVYINRGTNGNRVEYFDLLPFACRLERCEQDAELALICTKLLSMISEALTLQDCMSAALNKIDTVSKMSFWSARLSAIGVLQVLVFNNMSIVLSSPEWVEQVQNIVLRLLEDNVLEVREKAAQVLGGLLHCSFLPATEKLLELFKKKCRTKVKNRKRTMDTMDDSQTRNGTLMEDAVRTRHTGVLGLCAFISAYPYDIPDFVPDVFEHLGQNLNDPQPIPSTIRKTVGDFKRTHLDNWENHQLKFTENQLLLLSDLTVPPSYYV